MPSGFICTFHPSTLAATGSNPNDLGTFLMLYSIISTIGLLNRDIEQNIENKRTFTEVGQNLKQSLLGRL